MEKENYLQFSVKRYQNKEVFLVHISTLAKKKTR